MTQNIHLYLHNYCWEALLEFILLVIFIAVFVSIFASFYPTRFLSTHKPGSIQFSHLNSNLWSVVKAIPFRDTILIGATISCVIFLRNYLHKAISIDDRRWNWQTSKQCRRCMHVYYPHRMLHCEKCLAHNFVCECNELTCKKPHEIYLYLKLFICFTIHHTAILQLCQYCKY